MAFHPYPQVIPPVCNPDGFGPPRACSARFTLPKGRSPSFGSVARHLPPFRTRVRSGSGLGPPHPQLISMAAEPSGIRWEGFAPSSRYSCRHSHSGPLQVAFPLPFPAEPDAPLPLTMSIRSVGEGLSPGGLSAPRHHRPVSDYALFQGWLLLSQPPGCLCTGTTLPTEPPLRDLSWRSGLFPSRPRILAPVVSLHEHPPGIRRLVRVGKR